MKKIFLITAFVATSITLSAQNNTYNNPFGIGIASPQAQLHIHQPEEEEDPTVPILPNDPGGRDIFYHNYRTTFLMTNPNTPNQGFLMEQYNNDVTLNQKTNGFLKFQTPGGNFLLSRTGRFGFGDTIATHMFNVQGTSRFGSDVRMTQTLTVDGIVSTGGNMTVGGNLNTIGALTVGDIAQNPGGLTVNGTAHIISSTTIGGPTTLQGALTVANNAYIGATLTVAGNTILNGSLKVGNGVYCDAGGGMKVKYLKVTLTDWPDYVFGGNHTLMPLNELETYVNEHSHLPGVPSAAEVEENGADLGEMNKLLVEKVEELTLYIIDLQKQINELKSNR